MIVPSMNMLEIQREWEKEFPIIFRKAGYVAKEMHKTLKLNKEDEIVKYFDYLSKFKNNWIYSITFTKKRDYFIFLVYNYDRQGLNAYTVMGGDESYMFVFTAHFFKRYNERRKLSLVKPNDILRAFMDDNHSFSVQPLDDLNENMNNIICAADTGVLLGTADTKQKIYRMNTYLTNDMLKEDQKAITIALHEEFDHDGRDYTPYNP